VHRRRFTIAHGAARLIIGHRLGVPPGQIRWRRGPHGKPEVAWPATDLRVSLSHSGDLAALAMTRGRPVGVDVQQLLAGIDPVRMATRFFPCAEARLVTEAGSAGQVGRFAALWTRKEACVKVAGGRLMQGMRLPVGVAGQVIVHQASSPLPGPHLVQDVPAPPGFRAAVALDGGQPGRITRCTWPGALGPGGC
jgi:4'-phosphopantetheinyl transferase